jgi:hypothetical protein
MQFRLRKSFRRVNGVDQDRLQYLPTERGRHNGAVHREDFTQRAQRPQRPQRKGTTPGPSLQKGGELCGYFRVSPNVPCRYSYCYRFQRLVHTVRKRSISRRIPLGAGSQTRTHRDTGSKRLLIPVLPSLVPVKVNRRIQVNTPLGKNLVEGWALLKSGKNAVNQQQSSPCPLAGGFMRWLKGAGG